MADLKISQLTAITTLTPATDVLPVVDVTGTTKKITTNQILGSGGTATLASATISGNLTVRTNALTVDANNNVGIGTTAPTVYTNYRTLAIVGGSTGGVIDINPSGGVTAGGMQISSTATGTTINSIGPSAGTATPLIINTGTYGSTAERYRIAGDGVATWSNVGGVAGTAMTLNATGLGVGVSPTNKLTIGTGTFNASTASGSASLYSTVANGLVVLADGMYVATRAGVNRLVVDTSGNIISNVTSTAPSLTDNGFMVFNLTSNTNLRISVRGSDGVTRVANITLA